MDSKSVTTWLLLLSAVRLPELHGLLISCSSRLVLRRDPKRTWVRLSLFVLNKDEPHFTTFCWVALAPWSEIHIQWKKPNSVFVENSV